jgi:Na+-translocating ferredoxin:NAD+ oxidoreductase RnfD subunit
MKYIAINFGFLYTMPGRTFFVLFVGFMSYSLGVFGIISMAVLCGVLIMHYIVRCMHPRFEEYMRKKDYAGK